MKLLVKLKKMTNEKKFITSSEVLVAQLGSQVARI